MAWHHAGARGVRYDSRLVEEHIARNADAHRRLVAVIDAANDPDLERPLEGGWTVAAVLAHLAYWDRRVLLLLERWERGQLPPRDEPEWYADDVVNDALLPEWLALPTRSAARLAIDAAGALNARVQGLDARTAQAIIVRDEAWLLHRYRHRSEYLDEIERALGDQ